MQKPAPSALAEELPPPWRLAVAYAPRAFRAQWTALLALDLRLARTALHTADPLVAQLRLAWWRDRFREDPRNWPAGEPLLGALAVFGERLDALGALVDSWEAIAVHEDRDRAVAQAVAARAGAIVALAEIAEARGDMAAIAAVARSWAEIDLARRLGATPPLASGSKPLPRAMRPLVVLHRLAAIEAGESSGLGALFGAVWVGLRGR